MSKKASSELVAVGTKLNQSTTASFTDSFKNLKTKRGLTPHFHFLVVNDLDY